MEERTKSDGEERPFPESTAIRLGKGSSLCQGHYARVYITSQERFSDLSQLVQTEISQSTVQQELLAEALIGTNCP